MTVVILDLVSDRRERRVSGIHASTVMISKSRQDVRSTGAKLARIAVLRCVNPIAARGERCPAG
jgi:hypothetical protein